MKYNKSKSLLISLLLIAAFALSAVAGTPNVRFNDIRALGMGGPGIATMTDMNAMMYNPAMLGKAEFGLDLISIQGHLSKDAIDLVDFIDRQNGLRM